MQSTWNIVFILFTSVIVIFAESDEYKLEQLQVLFRHGDRTPSQSEIFVNDPYDEIYRSYGYGQLTKIGKEREYKIGELLRKRYDAFLGEYKNGEVYAYSTDIDRTKMSLQLVLAGLYPPTPATFWSDSVNWQPIPTHYASSTSSYLTSAIVCPTYKKHFRELANFLLKSKALPEYESFMHRIENKTGITSSTYGTAWSMYHNLRSALSLGLPLSANLSIEDFDTLEQIMSIVLKGLTHTEQMRRAIAGPVVQQFLKVFHDNDNSKKVYLYSGHDINLATFIDAHNITEAPKIQDYGSTLILEKLRGPDDRAYIRVYLWTGVSEKLIPLKFENCDHTCLLLKYAKIAKPILPDEKSRMCTSPTVLCRRRIESAEDVDFDLQLSHFFVGSDLTSFKYTKDFYPYSIEMS